MKMTSLKSSPLPSGDSRKYTKIENEADAGLSRRNPMEAGADVD
jgi:hypothetical protein